MSGQWPPDWEDQEDDVEAEAGQPDAETNARLSEVTAYLAALPHPVMPEALEARISAAIAAEAERAEPAGRTLGPPPRRPKVRRSRKFRVRAISSVAACLVIAGFGYLLTRAGGSPSSSSAALSPGIPSAAAGRAEHSFNQAVPEPAAAAASPSAAASSAVRITVTSRGDVYQRSTLVSQVRERLGENLGSASAFAGPSYAPTAALAGCALRVTDGATPGLVDKATYEGKPVYVIATSSRAWVVGRGCTATDPELITTVSLAGLRGNLSALGSVEG